MVFLFIEIFKQYEFDNYTQYVAIHFDLYLTKLIYIFHQFKTMFPGLCWMDQKQPLISVMLKSLHRRHNINNSSTSHVAHIIKRFMRAKNCCNILLLSCFHTCKKLQQICCFHKMLLYATIQNPLSRAS